MDLLKRDNLNKIKVFWAIVAHRIFLLHEYQNLHQRKDCDVEYFLIFYLIRSDKNEKLIFSIIIGGAIGNFYDRLVYKAVPDFIDIHFANFHWFTFNVADIFITLGVMIYLFKGFFIK